MATVGTSVRLTARFYAGDGSTLADPSAVTCTVTKPDGTTASPSAAADSVGLWHADYVTTVAGLHQFYFTGTGTNAQVTIPDVFNVTTAVTNALVGLQHAKNFLQMGTNTDPTTAAQLTSFIQSASSIVNAACGYSMSTTFTETATVTVDGSGRRVLALSKCPVLSVQSVTPLMQGLPTIDLSTLVIDKNAGLIYLANWWAWYGPQSVAYTAGRATVPTQVRDAVLVIVSWMWETQRGGSVAVPNMGGEDVSPYTFMGMPGFPTHALANLRMADMYAAPGMA